MLAPPSPPRSAYRRHRYPRPSLPRVLPTCPRGNGMRIHLCHRTATVSLVLLALIPAASWAGNWPGWRGPTGMGYTDEKDLPLTWDGKTGEHLLWKAPLDGI